MSDYYVVNGGVYSVNELYHHGVKGMKWGVRRYQNEDGSLTAAGEKRFQRVANSKFRTWSNTSSAKHVYKANKNRVDAIAKFTQGYANRQNNKAEKYKRKADMADVKGDSIKSTKYRDIMTESIDISRNSRNVVKALIESSQMLDRKIANIDNGTLKAGRDFITYVQTRGSVTTTYVIERNSQKR